jgi:hypothetical protein
MISQHRTRAGLAAGLAIASLAASASGASADPNPEQRVQSRAAALAQEQYYMSSQEPPILAPAHDLRTIDARDAADAPDGAVTRATAPVTAQPESADDFAWDDAAIGAGGALGLALVFAGGAVAITRRNGRTATS